MEAELSSAVSQLTAAVFADVQALAALDPGAPRAAVQAMEMKLQDGMRQMRSLLAELQYAAEEQETCVPATTRSCNRRGSHTPHPL